MRSLFTPAVRAAVAGGSLGLLICTTAPADTIGIAADQDGDWRVADTWVPQQVPNNGGGDAFDVTVAGYTVTLAPASPAAPITVQNLTVSGNLNEGRVAVTLDPLTVTGDVAVQGGGAVALTGSALSVGGTMTVDTSGSLYLLDSAASVVATGGVGIDGAIYGSGAVNSPVSMGLFSNLSPGAAGGETDTLSFASLTTNLTLFGIEIASPSDHDAIAVAGTALIDGILLAATLDDYEPAFSDEFTVVTASTLIAQGATADGSPVPVSTPSGEVIYYVDVRGTAGSGQSLVLTQQVPEPGALSLLGLAALALVRRRR